MSDALKNYFDGVAENEGRADKINRLYGEFTALMVKSACIAYQMGMELYEQKKDLDAGEDFRQWVEINLTFSAQKAYDYIRLYVWFEENPDKLKQLTITDAMVMAGIKQRIEKSVPEESISVKNLGDPEEINIERIFSQKPVSGLNLKYYRVENFKGELWVYTKHGDCFPACNMLIAKPRNLPETEWVDLIKNTQTAFEAYFAKVEQYQENGVIPEPQSTKHILKKKGVI